MITNKIPSVLTELISPQNQSDTEAFTACFSDDAVVHDEGETHVGKDEIQE